MIYVISDLHGYPPKRLLQLLEKASFGKQDFLYILGDVVDRNGDGGVETLNWLMYQTNVQLLRGNHESMLLANAFIFDEITEDKTKMLYVLQLVSKTGCLSDSAHICHGRDHQSRRHGLLAVLYSK